MLAVVPDLLKLGAAQLLYSLIRKYFKSDKMRQVFSFDPLLIGGNPLKVPAIYAMIHFVEKTWGVHFAIGGTGALVQALVRKFEELGGSLLLNAEVIRIDVEKCGCKRVATGVTLASGETLTADLVVSNADYAPTHLRLIDKAHRRINSDALVKFRKQSMSLMVIYFGYEKRVSDPEPRLTQTAFFRPHNRSEDVMNLYLVGQGTQPGRGTPAVMMSAKMTAREIARDFAIDQAVVDGIPG